MNFVETYKDKCIEQTFQIQELYERIFELKEKIYEKDDVIDRLIELLMHSNIPIGIIEKFFNCEVERTDSRLLEYI